MANEFCSVCGACGCGVKIYHVNNLPYCGIHVPKLPTPAKDDQVLTPQQKLTLNGQ